MELAFNTLWGSLIKETYDEFVRPVLSGREITLDELYQLELIFATNHIVYAKIPENTSYTHMGVVPENIMMFLIKSHILEKGNRRLALALYYRLICDPGVDEKNLANAYQQDPESLYNTMKKLVDFVWNSPGSAWDLDSKQIGEFVKNNSISESRWKRSDHKIYWKDFIHELMLRLTKNR